MEQFRIIIDTNVIVAAMRSKRGASNQLLQRLKDPELSTHVSNTLLFEYEEVLRRDQQSIAISDEQIRQLLDGFCRLAVKHYIPFLWRPAAREPDDDFLVDLAVVARATHLVTHNIRDLKRAGEHFGICVVTPSQFLGILRTVYE